MLSRPNTCASRSRSAARVLGPALLERLADAAGEAAGERDQPARVALEQLPVDARLRVVALEVAERAELDQVRVAGVRLGQERQVRVAARARVAVVGDVDLAADDRLDPLVARRLVEVDRAGERAVVGERHRRHLELGRAGRERRDPARPVEDRVLAVDVQVDEVGAHGGAILEPAPEDTLEPAPGGWEPGLVSRVSGSRMRAGQTSLGAKRPFRGLGQRCGIRSRGFRCLLSACASRAAPRAAPPRGVRRAPRSVGRPSYRTRL